MSDYVKKVDELAIMVYATTLTEDTIEVCLLSEGDIEEFNKDEFFDAWQILLSPLFADYLTTVKYTHNYGEYYKDYNKHLKTLDTLTYTQAQDLAHYKSMWAHYKERKFNASLLLRHKYGHERMRKASKLYEGLYRIPAYRIW